MRWVVVISSSSTPLTFRAAIRAAVRQRGAAPLLDLGAGHGEGVKVHHQRRVRGEHLPHPVERRAFVEGGHEREHPLVHRHVHVRAEAEQ